MCSTSKSIGTAPLVLSIGTFDSFSRLQLGRSARFQFQPIWQLTHICRRYLANLNTPTHVERNPDPALDSGFAIVL